MTLIIVSLLSFTAGLLLTGWLLRSPTPPLSLHRPNVVYSIDEWKNAVGVLGPTPLGELEWAYGVLEKAKREEREARDAEILLKRRAYCREHGHVELIDISTINSYQYICNHCGTHVYGSIADQKRPICLTYPDRTDELTREQKYNDREGSKLAPAPHTPPRPAPPP